MTKEKSRAIRLALKELDSRTRRIFKYTEVKKVADKYGLKPKTLKFIGHFNYEETNQQKQRNGNSNSKQK